MNSDDKLTQFKVVRLTAPIFHTTEFEIRRFAQRGLSLTVVDAGHAVIVETLLSFSFLFSLFLKSRLEWWPPVYVQI